MRENTKTPPAMRTPQELAAALGLQPQTVMKFCREERIKCIRVGRLYRIPAPEFDRVLREGVPQVPGEQSGPVVSTSRQARTNNRKEVSQ